jgi:cysteinyl-tRNA synthetase
MVHYWMHNNMITINGQKMGKVWATSSRWSSSSQALMHRLDRAYSPMTIRFFILSAHYRGTVDFSNEALQSKRERDSTVY